MAPDFSSLRVALVHYWLVNHGGGERVLDCLAAMFPQADVFSVVADPTTVSAEIRKHKLTTSFLQNLPGSVRYYRHFLPLYPLALESFDLSSYDLVISHESGPTKGVITRPDACHICYSESPMRYVWDMYHSYRATMGAVTRTFFSAASHYLRMWDVSSATRVDHFIATSTFIEKRIMKYYRRESTVIHPPVNVPGAYASEEKDNYYLMVGRITDYKRVDLAVSAFNRNGRTLRIVGDGPTRGQLERQAASNVTFLGRLSDEEIHRQYARCRALIFPGMEDFGIVPLEAQAFGKPVIAYGEGGVVDTVIPYRDGTTPAEFSTGIFFDSQTASGIQEAIEEFELQESNFRAGFIRAHALRFRSEEFTRLMSEFVETRLASHAQSSRYSAHLPVV
jgi:glycosyltransferase involved in cell wall biosynthesis